MIKNEPKQKKKKPHKAISQQKVRENTIGLRITPSFFAEKYSVVEICIIYKTWGFAWINEEWLKIMIDPIVDEAWFNLQTDELIAEYRRANETAVQIFRDAKAGRITEEFFNNQEVDAE